MAGQRRELGELGEMRRDTVRRKMGEGERGRGQVMRKGFFKVAGLEGMGELGEGKGKGKSECKKKSHVLVRVFSFSLGFWV